MSEWRIKRRLEAKNRPDHPLNLFPDEHVISVTNDCIEKAKLENGKLYLNDICDVLFSPYSKHNSIKNPGSITSIKRRVCYYMQELGYSVTYRTAHTTMWDVS